MDKKQKQKKQYIIIVDGVAPVKVEYALYADDEEQAYEMFKAGKASVRQRPETFIHQLVRQKVTIKEWLTGIVKLIRKQ